MQSVHVLGDQRKPRTATLQPDEGVMRWVRIAFQEIKPPRVVKPPDPVWVAGEPLRMRDLLNRGTLPQSAGAAKRGQSALGGYPSPGHHRNASGMPDPCSRPVQYGLSPCVHRMILQPGG